MILKRQIATGVVLSLSLGLAGAMAAAAPIGRPARAAAGAVAAAIACLGIARLTRLHRLMLPRLPAHHRPVHDPDHLIREIVRLAVIAQEKGVGALAHPLNRSADPLLGYALDLVARQPEPRLLELAVEDRCDLEEARSAARTRRCLPLVWGIGGIAALAGSAAGLLALLPSSLEASVGDLVGGAPLLFGCFLVSLGAMLALAGYLTSRVIFESCRARRALLSRLVILGALAIAAREAPERLESILRSKVAAASAPRARAMAA
jgi:hypothetical protein